MRKCVFIVAVSTLFLFSTAYANQDLLDAVEVASGTGDWTLVKTIFKQRRNAKTLDLDFKGDGEFSIRERLLQEGQLDLLAVEDDAPSVIEEDAESLIASA